ncbi:lantibiotic immunity ABC transporter MutG family permease subunit [Bacillaceae bacterium]
MMKLFASEWMKTKRTPVRWLPFFTPLVFAALILWYCSLRKTTEDLPIFIFQIFFEVWTALAIPLGAGLVSGLMIQQEELAGNFQPLLGSQWPRRNLYLGKLALLVFLAAASTMLAASALAAGAWLIFHAPIPWPAFIGAAVMALIGALPLLAFHLWISFAWGMGASIGIGVGGLLIAALMATGLGDRVWPWVPWAWPVRFAGLAGASSFIIAQAIQGMVPAAVFFAAMLSGGLIWFNRWEGRKKGELG